MKKRPVDLNLFAFKFPLPALASIQHRMSGGVAFLLLSCLLYGLDLSLYSLTSFKKLKSLLLLPIPGFIAWVFLSALIYHFVAGIRHLLMDMHIGEGYKGGRISAFLTLAISYTLILLLGAVFIMFGMGVL